MGQVPDQVRAEEPTTAAPSAGGSPAAGSPAVGSPAAGLQIRVSTGAGAGRTRLAAFDAALRAAGVADFNLVRLSSMIPPGSTVSEHPAGTGFRLVGGHGDLLYCVYAGAYADEPGTEAWAGLAWSTHEDGSGSGIFVEHSGATEDQVRTELGLTIADLNTGRDGRYREAGTVLSRAVYQDQPVCAVAIAAYRTVGWDEDGGRRG